jgi:hypothetical protein
VFTGWFAKLWTSRLDLHQPQTYQRLPEASAGAAGLDGYTGIDPGTGRPPERSELAGGNSGGKG